MPSPDNASYCYSDIPDKAIPRHCVDVCFRLTPFVLRPFRIYVGPFGSSVSIILIWTLRLHLRFEPFIFLQGL
ncbi:hypothetical protein K7X08_000809 [Anisodus acutangulus]|uniref:Uncharacterized protein n=1 Tax=Anisodus acutangulus TaxID=402998 RepID=A0A9Q1LR37_9SOLA|nr:hypothetical protein K7X08_000809 [Anisodus acutangulus]